MFASLLLESMIWGEEITFNRPRVAAALMAADTLPPSSTMEYRIPMAVSAALNGSAGGVAPHTTPFAFGGWLERNLDHSIPNWVVSSRVISATMTSIKTCLG